MTDNEATRSTFVRTRPALHEDEDKAEAGCYEGEAKAENFGLEATLASRTNFVYDTIGLLVQK